jgi:hypothetical protein
MTYNDASRVLAAHQKLQGQRYHDTRKNQVDIIRELVITPQDHPFYPEFIRFYEQTGSYQEASRKAFDVHAEDILYAVKCVLEEIYDVRENREMHVLMDLKYVMKFIPEG